MDSSSTQSQLRKLRFALHLSGASGLAVMFLVAWSFLIRPIDAQQRVTRARMARLESTLSEADEIQTEHASLLDRLSADQDQEAALQARIPDDAAEAEFLALASELALRTGLKIKHYRPGKPVEEESCSSLEVELICAGDYPSLCGFVDGISKLPRLSRIERLHIDAAKGTPDYLIEISVLLYFAARSEDSPVEGGEPRA
jgi:Tfp pilus assembly protein PilO